MTALTTPPAPATPPAPPAEPEPRRRTVAHFVGVDLGQAADFTAIAVVARRDAVTLHDGAEYRAQVRAEHHLRGLYGEPPRPEPPPPAFDVTHLERLPRNTPYPDAARYVGRLVTHPALTLTDGHPITGERRRVPPALVVDATGVGRPVVDLFRQAKLEPVAVTITGGDATTFDGGGWKVPKRELVSGLQVLLQARRLRISSHLPDAAVLTDELLRFKVKIDPVTAHDSYGAWRAGEHDDLVLALAVAVWYAERRWRPPMDLSDWPAASPY